MKKFFTLIGTVVLCSQAFGKENSLLSGPDSKIIIGSQRQHRDGSVTLRHIYFKTNRFEYSAFAYKDISSYTKLCKTLGFDGALLYEGLNRNKKSYLINTIDTTVDTVDLYNDSYELNPTNQRISKVTCFHKEKLRTIVIFKKKGEPGHPPSLISEVRYLRANKLYPITATTEQDLQRVCRLLDHKKLVKSHPFNQISQRQGPKIELTINGVRPHSVYPDNFVDQLVCQ